MIFDYMSKLVLKILFFLSPILLLTFVLYLKYVSIINGVNRYANEHLTLLTTCHVADESLDAATHQWHQMSVCSSIHFVNNKNIFKLRNKYY